MLGQFCLPREMLNRDPPAFKMSNGFFISLTVCWQGTYVVLTSTKKLVKREAQRDIAGIPVGQYAPDGFTVLRFGSTLFNSCYNSIVTIVLWLL